MLITKGHTVRCNLHSKTEYKDGQQPCTYTEDPPSPRRFRCTAWCNGLAAATTTTRTTTFTSPWCQNIGRADVVDYTPRIRLVALSSSPTTSSSNCVVEASRFAKTCSTSFRSDSNEMLSSSRTVIPYMARCRIKSDSSL